MLSAGERVPRWLLSGFFAACAGALVLRCAPEARAVLTLIVIFLGVAHHFRRGWGFFGIALPLVGFLGDGAPASLGFALLALNGNDGAKSRPVHLWAIAILPLAWSIGELTLTFQVPAGLITAAGWVAALLIMQKASDGDLLQSLRGLGVGTVAALIVLALQGGGAIPNTLLAAPNPFWSALGRLPGTFSDPNAAGVFLALAAPLLLVPWGAAGRIRVVAAVGLVVLLIFVGGLTGSRSLLLGLGVWATISLFRWRALAVLLPICLALVLWVVMREEYVKGLESAGAPKSLVRAARSLVSQNGNDSLSSRQVTSKVAFDVWREHPLLGVGFLRFPQYFAPHAERLGLKTGFWSDNPNNFYLQLLVEFGLAGGLLALLALCAVGFRDEPNALVRGSQSSVLVLAALLLVGPHVIFSEIALLSGIAAAGALKARSVSRKLLGLICALSVIFTLIFFFAARDASFGLFNWEGDLEGTFRWTAGRSKFYVSCRDRAEQRIRLRFAGPVPQSATVRIAGGPPETSSGAAGTVMEVQASCPEHGSPDRLAVELEVIPTWTPGGGDNRQLGVQLRVPNLSEGARSF